MKRFLDLSSSLNILGINVTNHSHLTYMECKKLIKADPKKITASANKEAASSSSESPTAIVFLSISDYNRSGSLIVDIRQDMLKGNNNYPRNVTSAYDMLTRFDLDSPRCHHNKRMVENVADKIMEAVVEGTIHWSNTQHHRVKSSFPGLYGHTPYCIKCFNCEKWGHYDNQFPLFTIETLNAI